MSDSGQKQSGQDSGERAVVLLSGGVDSATCLAIARAAGHECHCLTVRYGQRHGVELRAAERVAAALGAASRREVEIDLRGFGGSALTGDIDVPKGGGEDGGTDWAGEIPVTYVPARNTIFLSYALALAEVIDAGHIYIGVNEVDYSGYPDCRPEFVSAFQKMADLATRAGVEGHGPKIEAPLAGMSKREILARGIGLGVDYGMTHSCYDPVGDAGAPCGGCDSCRIRAAAFAELGTDDPAIVRAGSGG